MKRFAVGQRWIAEAAMYGRFLGEVIDTSAKGQRGTVVITDDRGNVLDTYIGIVTKFQASGEWQLAEQRHDCALPPPCKGSAGLFRRRSDPAAAKYRWPLSRTVQAAAASRPRLADRRR
jgi:hypothetical protein